MSPTNYICRYYNKSSYLCTKLNTVLGANCVRCHIIILRVNASAPYVEEKVVRTREAGVTNHLSYPYSSSLVRPSWLFTLSQTR